MEENKIVRNDSIRNVKYTYKKLVNLNQLSKNNAKEKEKESNKQIMMEHCKFIASTMIMIK